MLKIGKIINEPTMVVESGTILPPKYVISEVLDLNNYIDITSNNTYIDIAIHEYDYLYVRNLIKTRTATLGFNNLSLEEQEVASKHFCVSKENRDLVHTEDEQKDNWTILISETQKNRLVRWVKAKSYISYKLAPLDSSDLAIETEILSSKFVEYGIESMSLSGVQGLYDWLETTYTGKTYYDVNDKDTIIRILKTGK